MLALFYYIPFPMCDNCGTNILNDEGRVVTDKNNYNSDAEVVLIDGKEYEIDDVVRSDYEGQYIPSDDAICSEDEGYVFSDNAIYCERADEYRVNAIELYDGTYADENDTVELYDSDEFALSDECIGCNNGYYCSDYGPHENNYFVCENCDYICDVDDYAGDGLCNECGCSVCDFVHSYGYKPEPIFFTKGEGPTFGIELEYNEAMVEDNENVNVYDNELDQNLFYAKEDGSLTNGVEFVSHPFDMERYMENRNKLEKFVENIEGETGSGTGLHIHIGRKTLTEKQIENIVYLVNHNVAERSELSGRKSEQRARSYIDDDKGTCVEKSKCQRYSAVNLSPSQTIEIRTFRCSKLPVHILGRIELTICLVDYCKKGRQRSGLMSHIRYMSSKYNFINLKKLLREKGL